MDPWKVVQDSPVRASSQHAATLWPLPHLGLVPTHRHTETSSIWPVQHLSLMPTHRHTETSSLLTLPHLSLAPTHRCTETSPNLSPPLTRSTTSTSGSSAWWPRSALGLAGLPMDLPDLHAFLLKHGSISPFQSHSSPLSKLDSHSCLFLPPVKSPLILVLCSGHHVAVILAARIAVPVYTCLGDNPKDEFYASN